MLFENCVLKDRVHLAIEVKSTTITSMNIQMEGDNLVQLYDSITEIKRCICDFLTVMSCFANLILLPTIPITLI
jgi:hypothetical protein